MNELVKALAPAFAAGLGVQRLLEIVDAIFSGFPKLGDRKKLVMAIASVVLAAIVSCLGNIRILAYLPLEKQSPTNTSRSGETPKPVPGSSDPTANQSSEKQSSAQASQSGEPPNPVRDSVDLIVTILFISGGTEGLNALLKFLNYKKEESKGSAATALSDADGKKIKSADALSVVSST